MDPHVTRRSTFSPQTIQLLTSIIGRPVHGQKYKIDEEEEAVGGSAKI